MTSDRNSTGLDTAPQAGAGSEFGAQPGMTLEQHLARVVASHVVPRLTHLTRARSLNRSNAGSLAYREAAPSDGALRHGSTRPDQAELDRFVAALIAVADEASTVMTQGYLDRGHSINAILLDLFGPAARRLGKMWEDDEITFVDVTIGVGRLQQLLNNLPPQPKLGPPRHRNVLLLPTPGEDHSFGVAVLGDILERAGWAVTLIHQATAVELRRILKRQHFVAVGFSLSTDALTDRLIAAIRTVRVELDATPTTIVVGGRAFDANLELARRVGADAAPGDAEATLDYLERFMALTYPDFDARQAISGHAFSAMM
jgi:MerR family transcriptional regulator, light-induced transcriptional regulator